MKRFLILCAVMVVGACSLSAETRTSLREAVVDEMLYRIDQLQAIGAGQVEVSPEVLIAADAGCTALTIGSPLLTEAINRKIAEKNIDKPIGEQIDPLDVAELRDSLRDACAIVRAILVLKPAPEVAPVPVPAPA